VLAGTSLLHLLELSTPFRAEWAVLGTDGNGWSTAGEPATIHVYPPTDATANRRVEVAVELTSSPYHPARERFRIEGATRPVRGSVPRANSVVARAGVCLSSGQPVVLTVRTPGDTVLPGGKHVGLAITAVRTKPAGRCAA